MRPLAATRIRIAAPVSRSTSVPGRDPRGRNPERAALPVPSATSAQDTGGGSTQPVGTLPPLGCRLTGSNLPVAAGEHTGDELGDD